MAMSATTPYGRPGVVGRRLTHSQDWLNHSDPDDSYWKDRVFSDVEHVQADVDLVTGWHDIFFRANSGTEGPFCEPRAGVATGTPCRNPAASAAVHSRSGVVPGGTRRDIDCQQLTARRMVSSMKHPQFVGVPARVTWSPGWCYRTLVSP